MSFTGTLLHSTASLKVTLEKSRSLKKLLDKYWQGDNIAKHLKAAAVCVWDRMGLSYTNWTCRHKIPHKMYCWWKQNATLTSETFFFGGSTGVWTQGLVLAMQVAWATPPVFFALVVFGIGFHIYSWADLDHNPPIYASSVAGMIGVCHHTQLLIEMGFSWTPPAPRTDLKPRSSWVAGITSMNYCVQLKTFLLV
jgi:hypothetical protein